MQRIPSGSGLLAWWDPTDSIMRRANVVFQGRHIKGGPVPRRDNGTSKWHVKLALRLPNPPAFDFGRKKIFLHICEYLGSTSLGLRWRLFQLRMDRRPMKDKKKPSKHFELGGQKRVEKEKKMCFGGKCLACR